MIPISPIVCPPYKESFLAYKILSYSVLSDGYNILDTRIKHAASLVYFVCYEELLRGSLQSLLDDTLHRIHVHRTGDISVHAAFCVDHERRWQRADTVLVQ